MEHNEFGRQVETLSTLDEPVRRRLYLYVVGQDREVGRDEAARALRTSRALAAFHLDKLVAAGLLEATFRRLSGRAGPGAGRPSKLYRRASVQFEVTLPRRRYELAAHVLADALATEKARDRPERVRHAARIWGRGLARESMPHRRTDPPLRTATRALRAIGFEPQQSTNEEIVLRNCPFDSLRGRSRDLICGMNLALIEGLLAGLGLPNVEARLAPRAGMCCVALREKAHKKE